MKPGSSACPMKGVAKDMSDHHIHHAQARDGPRHLADGPSVVTVQQMKEEGTDLRGPVASGELGVQSVPGQLRGGVE